MKRGRIILILVLILAIAVTVIFIIKQNDIFKKDNDELVSEEENKYSGLLDEYYNIISNGVVEVSTDEGKMGVSEAVMYGNTLSDIGYKIEDLNNDGIPELIIGFISDNNDSKSYGSNIFAVYTYKNDKTVLIFESTARSMYSFMNNGELLYQGSAGTLYSIFGVYEIAENGEKLNCKDYYFTYEKDKTYETIGFYHNTSGKFEKSASKELKISREEFEEINEKYRQDVKKIELTPFSQYKK